jgi:hypothetical protein
MKLKSEIKLPSYVLFHDETAVELKAGSFEDLINFKGGMP